MVSPTRKLVAQTIHKVEEPILDTLRFQSTGVSFVYEKNSVNICYNGDVKSEKEPFYGCVMNFLQIFKITSCRLLFKLVD